jgi:hypothetical protein
MIIKRRINYTGRKKIDKSLVKINLQKKEKESDPSSFTADLHLKPLSLPSDAKVYIEAYYTTSRQRFDFGTVESIIHPDTAITEVDSDGPLLFRIKIVDDGEKEGRLLASADRVRALNETEDEDKDYLIKVSKKNLDSVPWDLQIYDEDDEKPELILNNNIPDAIAKLRDNAIFQALILPVIIRQVYEFILYEHKGRAEDNSWQLKWLVFGEQISGAEIPGPGAEEPEIESYIDEVLRKFCAAHKLIDRMNDRLSEAKK